MRFSAYEVTKYAVRNRPCNSLHPYRTVVLTLRQRSPWDPRSSFRGTAIRSRICEIIFFCSSLNFAWKFMLKNIGPRVIEKNFGGPQSRILKKVENHWYRTNETNILGYDLQFHQKERLQILLFNKNETGRVAQLLRDCNRYGRSGVRTPGGQVGHSVANGLPLLRH